MNAYMMGGEILIYWRNLFYNLSFHFFIYSVPKLIISYDESTY